MQEDLHKVREKTIKVSEEINDSKRKLTSMYKAVHELKWKLDFYDSEKSRIESDIDNANLLKADILREMERARRDTDEVRKKIESCTKAGCKSALNNGCREFSKEEILAATDRFSEKLVVSNCDDGIVYKGRLDHIDVAVKFMASLCSQSSEEFNSQVEILRQLRHPHVVSTIGACADCKCIIFEYLHGGTLHSSLFSEQIQSKKHNCLLPWHTRIRIAAEVCSAVGFLNSGRPQTVTRGHVDPSHVFLDHNLVAKISIPLRNSALVLGFDVVSLGKLIMQLLTGKKAVTAEEVQDALGNLKAILDPRAGEWPMEIAREFAEIGLRYGAKENDVLHNTEDVLRMMRELELLELRAKKRRLRRPDEVAPELMEVPTSAFLCPIFQEVMKEPYVAADGFSYELEAIKGWIDGGHETSPMTNLKLNHKHLTPNHTLRSFIDNWRNSRFS